jgi:hypothetical protein
MAVVGQAVGAKVGNTVVVRRGKTLSTVRVARDLTVADKDNLLLVAVNGTYIAVARTDLAASAARKIDEDDEPDAKPKLVTGTTVIAPIETRTYRNGAWKKDTSDLWQGNVGGGLNTGVAFFGEQVRQLKGSTINRVRMNVTRIPGGSVSAQTSTLWLVTQKKRPSGAATLTSSTTGPVLAVGESNPNFDVPTAWITSMANNTAGGLALYDADGSPVMRFAGIGTHSPAFTLTIDWQRTES